jgi:hypothetical protein
VVIYLFNVQSFFSIHITFTYIHGAVSFTSPFCSPCSPLYPAPTYLAPSSCDRNCPPPFQVACKLTLFAPPLTQLSHPSQFPGTPTAQPLVTTTLGPIRSCYAEQKQTARCWVGQGKQGIYLRRRTNRRLSLSLDRGHEGHIHEVLQEGSHSSM